MHSRGLQCSCLQCHVVKEKFRVWTKEQSGVIVMFVADSLETDVTAPQSTLPHVTVEFATKI